MPFIKFYSTLIVYLYMSETRIAMLAGTLTPLWQEHQWLIYYVWVELIPQSEPV